jgi:hypothetical protein
MQSLQLHHISRPNPHEIAEAPGSVTKDRGIAINLRDQAKDDNILLDRDYTVLSRSNTCGRGEVDAKNRFHQLGWKRLSVILVVTAVALGTLSVPSAFATLGMAIGTVACVLLGLAAM